MIPEEITIRYEPLLQETTTIPPVVTRNDWILTIDGIDIDLEQIPEEGYAEASIDSLLSGINFRNLVTIKFPYSKDVCKPKYDLSICAVGCYNNGTPVKHPVIWKDGYNV